MALTPGFWSGRRVLITGHTGFKGGWLALWLSELGAEIQGYALPAATEPALWHEARLASLIPGQFADISDATVLAQAVAGFRPEIILHLAAQPLVRESYRSPADTYAVNVMGTVNLLEAARHCETLRAIVVVTTDKCYENREWPWPYREADGLGGIDPYSSSKACVELLCASWRDSFLRERGVALATARAGNVLGGGDWSAERLVPDILQAWQRGETVTLRYPQATRPWQHVLDPLNGYLMLAQALVERGDEVASAWNFGPDADGVARVRDVVDGMARHWPSCPGWSVTGDAQPHEAGLLTLDSSKARQQLGWRPCWDLPRSLEATLQWHRAWQAGQDMQAFSRAQLAAFQGDIR